MDWIHLAKYSRYHPDNLNKLPHKLPEAPAFPEPVMTLPPAESTEKPVPGKRPTTRSGWNKFEQQQGYWGHRLCCEPAWARNETSTRIKGNVVRSLVAGDRQLVAPQPYTCPFPVTWRLSHPASPTQHDPSRRF